MTYKVEIEQEVKHTRSNGEEWQSTEYLHGETEDFGQFQTLMSIVTRMFPNTKISVTATNGNEEE